MSEQIKTDEGDEVIVQKSSITDGAFVRVSECGVGGSAVWLTRDETKRLMDALNNVLQLG